MRYIVKKVSDGLYWVGKTKSNGNTVQDSFTPYKILATVFSDTDEFHQERMIDEKAGRIKIMKVLEDWEYIPAQRSLRI